MRSRRGPELGGLSASYGSLQPWYPHVYRLCLNGLLHALAQSHCRLHACRLFHGPIFIIVIEFVIKVIVIIIQDVIEEIDIVIIISLTVITVILAGIVIL
jgi:hypothetical protein